MSVFDYILISVILCYFVFKWVKKDYKDYRRMANRFKLINKKYEDAYSKMRSHIEDVNEGVMEKLEKCRECLERLHGVDMDKRVEEWQKNHPEEMKEIERKREQKRNPYGF